jgi:acyl-CoA thioesterase-2
LLEILRVVRIGNDVYRSAAVFNEPGGAGLFGGQVAAQALRAASDTVAGDRGAHSLHAYFLRRGDANRPVIYEVNRDRDGRSYSVRRVTARQAGKIIFHMAASFHVPEDGANLQAVGMPTAPPPASRVCRPVTGRCYGVEFRDVSPATTWPSRVWYRFLEDLGDDRHVAACALTYVSDMFTGLFQFPVATPKSQLTSLDHAVWFHRPARMDGWMMMDLIAESVASGRGHYRGRLFDDTGKLIVGIAQESLFRV